MEIGIVGAGKLGFPVALAIESKGHEVSVYDIDERKIKNILESKRYPYLEKHVDKLLPKTKIKFKQLDELVRDSKIIFIAVQTPHDPKYEGITPLPKHRKDFDYRYLKKAVKDVSKIIKDIGEDRIVVIISTVLPGTIRREVIPLINKHVKLCYNPFFIAMGVTIEDFLHPEFVLFGAYDKDAVEKAKEFYKTITNAQLYECSIEEAELIKVTYNTFIGFKIEFANLIGEISHKLGINADNVTNALKLANVRLISGSYLSAGMSDGGACHPRDNIALSWFSKKLHLHYDLFGAIMKARENYTRWQAELIKMHLNGHKEVIILGKAYKPNTNLTYGSPSILLYNILKEKYPQLNVKMYDPYIDGETQLPLHPCLFFIGTKHDDFKEYNYPHGSTVVDPFGYIPDMDGVKVIRIGRNVN
ncbi:MAG: nucleotide sugar dehydrogenase [Candidatus Nitrosocaldaceae archaeon]